MEHLSSKIAQLEAQLWQLAAERQEAAERRDYDNYQSDEEEYSSEYTDDDSQGDAEGYDSSVDSEEDEDEEEYYAEEDEDEEEEFSDEEDDSDVSDEDENTDDTDSESKDNHFGNQGETDDDEEWSSSNRSPPPTILYRRGANSAYLYVVTLSIFILFLARTTEAHKWDANAAWTPPPHWILTGTEQPARDLRGSITPLSQEHADSDLGGCLIQGLQFNQEILNAMSIFSQTIIFLIAVISQRSGSKAVFQSESRRQRRKPVPKESVRPNMLHATRRLRSHYLQSDFRTTQLL